jgi:hypothetical protein
MQIRNQQPLECPAVLSDLILQAAREAIPERVERLLTLPAIGELNAPLLPLLVGLLDAVQTTARAIEDNAWDAAGNRLDDQLAFDLAGQCRAIARTIENSGQI